MKMNSKSIKVNNIEYLRIPVKTKILSPGDDILEVVTESTRDIIQPNDIITISESPLAITQGRAIPIKDIKVGWLANFLWRFVSKVKYGIGLRAPTSMQCAIDEVGSLRILFAAFIGGLGRLIGRRGKGDFYRIAGMQAALIDAAHTSPVPPYESCVIKGPKDPAKVSKRIKNATGNECAVMDINDIGGCWMIGGSDGIVKDFMEKVMLDNPQGQGDELTPICLIRKA
ncbi:MAG: coenzyme F420-0:L-glutamate ligase [Candidatus Cloacimonetes bacterium]|nr:coenzyme F420-0:L-glutamate ligase [Candidatus Cloacimonadota bacterium]MCF7814256.1 coenzyme F420-0:L-glutamate ligase [Candidatus Cloacimonadota bacterium]MCF7868463.1 coenzyme F420-0:L-glutamate ligase [Candidatus Cloacimonadota bacterium]MCF7883917.1 coenzyme F420-0:L-glutamate ligase [Candidatus Cloacimonadota bacterium]